VSFMAQKAQDAHERRHHFQTAEHIAPDHLARSLCDLEYWASISYQQRNNNLLLSETIGSIRQYEIGDISIIECGIDIGYRQRKYHAQARIFAIPPLTRRQLAMLHGMAFGIQSINDPVYKCELIPGKLFTNASGDAPDWVLSLEGE
jgi:hypothetical protein